MSVLYYAVLLRGRALCKMNGWMIQLQPTSSGEMQEFIRCTTFTVHYGYSLTAERALVVSVAKSAVFPWNWATLTLFPLDVFHVHGLRRTQ